LTSPLSDKSNPFSRVTFTPTRIQTDDLNLDIKSRDETIASQERKIIDLKYEIQKLEKNTAAFQAENQQ